MKDQWYRGLDVERPYWRRYPSGRQVLSYVWRPGYTREPPNGHSMTRREAGEQSRSEGRTASFPRRAAPEVQR